MVLWLTVERKSPNNILFSFRIINSCDSVEPISIFKKCRRDNCTSGISYVIFASTASLFASIA